MSIVTRLHCDGCHREMHWFEGFKRHQPPEGWHYWTRTDMGQGDFGADDAHLCSWDCLVAFVHRKRPLAKHLTPIRVVAS